MPAEVVGNTRTIVSTKAKLNPQRGLRARGPGIVLNDAWVRMESHGFALDIMTGPVLACQSTKGVVLFMSQSKDRIDVSIMRHIVDRARALTAYANSRSNPNATIIKPYDTTSPVKNSEPPAFFSFGRAIEIVPAAASAPTSATHAPANAPFPPEVNRSRSAPWPKNAENVAPTTTPIGSDSTSQSTSLLTNPTESPPLIGPKRT